MADIKKQAAKLLAEEIAQAITKRAGGSANASYALVAKSAQSLTGKINASQILGSLSSSQISDLNGAIAGVLIGVSSSTNPDDIEIKAVISDLAALEVKNFVADTAQVEELYANFGQFIKLVAEEGEFAELYSDLADIGLAKIDTAKIKWGQMETVDSDIILSSEGVVGSLTIGYLNVTDANIVSLSVGKLAIKDENGNLVQIVVDSEGDIKGEAIDGKFIGDNTMAGTKIIEDSITAAQIAAGTITAEEIAALGIKARNIDVGDLFAAEGFIAELQTNIISSDLSKNTSVIKLADDRIAMIIKGEDESETRFILTDKMLNAITDKIHLEANNIDLSANETVSIRASKINKDYHIGPLAPQEPQDGMLWMDTDANPNIWKKYDAEQGKWTEAEENFVSSMLEDASKDAIAKVFETEFTVDGETGTITSMAKKVAANEDGLESVNSAVEAITPEYIVNTVIGDEGFSEAVQKENSIVYRIVGNDGDTTSVEFTDKAITALTGKIGITAEQLDAVIEDVILKGENFKSSFEKLEFDGSNIDLSANDTIKIDAETVEAIVNNMEISGDNIKLTADQIDAIADQVEITGDKINLSANEEFMILLGRVDKIEEAPPQVFRQDTPPPSEIAKINSLWVCTGDIGSYKNGLVYQAIEATSSGISVHVDDNGELNVIIPSGSSIAISDFVLDEDTGYLYFQNDEVALYMNDNGELVDGIIWELVQDAELAAKIQQNADDIAALNTTTTDLINTVVADLQTQMDGKAETWFAETLPAPRQFKNSAGNTESVTAFNYPAATWTTNESLINHDGDLYYDTASNTAWRWEAHYTDETESKVECYWLQIMDANSIEALEQISNQQIALDKKVTVFTTTPTVPYAIGDMWITLDTNANDGIDSRLLLICMVPKGESEEYSIDDWDYAPGYGTLSDLATIKTDAQNYADTQIATLKKQVDGKAETWFYGIEPVPRTYVDDSGNTVNVTTPVNAPVNSWQESEYELHDGDLYYDTANNKAWRWVYNESQSFWNELKDAYSLKALDEIAETNAALDGKMTVFTTQPKPPYQKGDLWAQGEKGDLFVCITSRSNGSYYSSDWEKACQYQSEEEVQAFVDTMVVDTNTALGAKIYDLGIKTDGLSNTYFAYEAPVISSSNSASNPANGWTTVAAKQMHLGDQYFDRVSGLAYEWSVSNDYYLWMQITDSTEVAAIKAMSAAAIAADGMCRTFHGASTPTPPYSLGDLWAQGDGKELLICINAKATGGTASTEDWVVASADTIARANADAAQDAANKAGEVASEYKNYIKYDEDTGTLRLGDSQTSSELVLDSEGVGVDIGGNNYSKFTAKYVQFGNYQLRQSADGGLVFKMKR